MNRPCYCDKCYACWLWYHNSDWRAQHGGPAEKVAIPASVLRHGPETIITDTIDLPKVKLGFAMEINPPHQRETKFLPLRLNRCEFLDNRIEFRSGCGGWRCSHRCKILVIQQPVVPGVTCQACDSYYDSKERF